MSNKDERRRTEAFSRLTRDERKCIQLALKDHFFILGSANVKSDDQRAITAKALLDSVSEFYNE